MMLTNQFSMKDSNHNIISNNDIEAGDVDPIIKSKNCVSTIDVSNKTAGTTMTAGTKNNEVPSSTSSNNTNTTKGDGSITTMQQQQEQQPSQHHTNRWLLSFLIVFVGGAVCCAFLVLGIQNESQSTIQYFHSAASDIVNAIELSWHDYEIFSLWAHESCHEADNNISHFRPHDTLPLNKSSSLLNQRLHICSREEFRNLYEYILSVGLNLYSLQYVTRVEHQYRAAYEADTRKYLAEHYPDVNYTGMTARDGPELFYQTNHSVYYPVSRVEPIVGNEAAIDLDTYHSTKQLMDHVLSSWKPTLSPGVKLIQDPDPDTYSVYLVHPGIQTSLHKEAHSVTSTVIRIPDLLAWAARGGSINGKAVYVFDSTDKDKEPTFLGGIEVVDSTKDVDDDKYFGGDGVRLRPLPETTIDKMKMGVVNSDYYEQELNIVDRRWTVSVRPLDDSFQPNYIFVVVGGVIILAAFILLATINYIKMAAEADKAMMALRQIKRERHLNEYLAHEVRNPLTSAISALSFVSTNTSEACDMGENTKKELLDDIHIVDSSLNFINELLRSMLDINRCCDRQIKIDNHPSDVMRDILEPAAAILCTRSRKANIITECPPDLVVSTDRLRLKQIVLNLATNATKFVLEKGFVRLRAEVVTNHENVSSVVIYIEDSGPGVPLEKRENLFKEFQDSFDLLHQGTGIGLYVCKHLSTLMNAKVWLDETYNSGVVGCPGARFVVDLQQSPIDDFTATSLGETHCQEHSASQGLECIQSDPDPNGAPNAQTSSQSQPEPATALPSALSVLFVDDDLIIRKLFIRTVKKVAPEWSIQEACNGETALHLVDTNEFDLIFMDQYMPGIERPLLGTETVRQLRIKGVSAKICGLSANDIEAEFFEAGADAFMLKPFPCNKDALLAELQKVTRPIG